MSGWCWCFAQGYVYRKLVKKLDELRLMRIGILGMFLGLANLAAVAALASGAPQADLHFAWFLAAPWRFRFLVLRSSILR